MRRFRDREQEGMPNIPSNNKIPLLLHFADVDESSVAVLRAGCPEKFENVQVFKWWDENDEGSLSVVDEISLNRAKLLELSFDIELLRLLAK